MLEDSTMRRSTMGLMLTLAFAILAAPLLPLAQPPAKVPRIGFLLLGASSDNPDLLDAFRQGLRELGWVEGQNIAIASRYAEGDPDRFAALAAELVRLKVDVILVGNPLAAQAAQHATTGQAPIEVIVPEARSMPLYRLINDPFWALQERADVKPEAPMADLLRPQAAGA